MVGEDDCLSWVVYSGVSTTVDSWPTSTIISQSCVKQASIVYVMKNHKYDFQIGLMLLFYSQSCTAVAHYMYHMLLLFLSHFTENLWMEARVDLN